MKKYLFTTRVLHIFSYFSAPLFLFGLTFIVSFFISFESVQAKVLFEQSKTGTAYDIFKDEGHNTALAQRLPQYSGTPPVLNSSGTISYRGTAEWVRLKRISGVECDTRVWLTLSEPDGVTRIGDDVLYGRQNGEFCDFKITGPNRTDGKVGIIHICYNGQCSFPDNFILDGSRENEGYVSDGYYNSPESGGWAFQICDIDGCEGGFEPVATTTATTTATSTGASSVLFLPGIQASRLYTDGGSGTEDQIWVPNIDADVEKLRMTSSGMSLNDIYTRDILDELALPYAGINVYKGFISFMDELKKTEVIKDWEPFAYDWRYDVEEIAKNGTKYQNEVKSLVAEVERLASSSYSGKVTIIGHSNGGLVGKMLISELEGQGKEELVDKLVLIGTPQLGAPKAALVMLHGYDQKAVFGLVVNDTTARDVMKNLPGTYGLLPSNEYFIKSGDTLISSDNSVTTASIGTYGPINSYTSMNSLLTDSLNKRNDEVPINEPSTLNNNFLQYSISLKQSLDSWLPPDNVEIYEVVGTGNPTIRGVQYQSFPCRLGFLTCETGSYMKALPIFTSSGDETVPIVSASGQDGNKVTGIIDLIAEAPNTLIRPYKHMNLTESPTVQSFVESIVKFPYLSQTLEIPEYANVARNFKIIGVHSPVSLMITDSLGKKVGKIGNEVKEEIVGSQYLDLGDSSYVIIPDDILFEAEIKGQATGTYSITVDTLKNHNQTQTFRYIGASSTPEMKATFSFATSGYTNIKTDINNDGLTDLEQTLNGQVILPPALYSYPLLKTNIKALKLSKVLETVLLVQVDAALYWDTLTPAKPAYQKLEFAALDTLKATLLVYKQKKYITPMQYSALEIIVYNLRK